MISSNKIKRIYAYNRNIYLPVGWEKINLIQRENTYISHKTRLHISSYFASQVNVSIFYNV